MKNKDFEALCKERRHNEIVTLYSPKLEAYNSYIRHGFTTRSGGISQNERWGLNLSFTRRESINETYDNLRLLCEAEQLDMRELAVVNHEHGNNVLALDTSHCGRGITAEALPACDGIITNQRGITLMTLHSDCCGYIMYDPVSGCIGAAHAGWRGALARIGLSMVEAMHSHYGALAENIVAAVVPCICGDCYEVDLELAKRFAAEFDCDELYKAGKNGKALLDIERACALQLLDCGVRLDNIQLMHRCTYKEADVFYSYRRDGEFAGAMAAYIKIC